MIQTEAFKPFLGVVESVDDPEKMGRLQVRIFGVHPRNKGEIPTGDLPWFSAIISNSTSVSGIGHSIDYQPGSTVFGYLIGRDHQTGFILGSLLGKPDEAPNGNQGFYDPGEILPYYNPGESDINRLARVPSSHWMPGKKLEKKVESVETAVGSTWSELDYNNNCTYPMNKVYETSKEIHVKEYDDTPGEERIHEWHKSGSYTEIIDDGTRTVKVVGDGYELTLGNKNVYVKGNCNLTVDANCNTYVKGDWNIRVDGNINKEVGGDEVVNISGNNTKQAGGNIVYDASQIRLNS